MKKRHILAFLAFSISGFCSAQDNPSMSNNLSIGFNIGQIQRDFGIGLDVTSPYFIYDHVGIRARANLMFYEHVEGTETTWTPYTNISLGAIGVGGTIGGFMRLYGEGGGMILFPDQAFSSTDYELGGYGLFGFEFYMFDQMNYHIEIGGVGMGAKADKIANAPIYSNGLIVSAGFRIHF